VWRTGGGRERLNCKDPGRNRAIRRFGDRFAATYGDPGPVKQVSADLGFLELTAFGERLSSLDDEFARSVIHFWHTTGGIRSGMPAAERPALACHLGHSRTARVQCRVVARGTRDAQKDEMLRPVTTRSSSISRIHRRTGAVLAASTLFVTGSIVTSLAIATAPTPRNAAPVMQPAAPLIAVSLSTTPAPLAPPPAPPAPPPAVEPAPSAPVRPRATAPRLDPACIVHVTPPDAACGWDDGFPAISGDGALIAVKRIPDEGGAMEQPPALWIDLLDVGTSRVVRRLPIFSGDEYVPDDDSRWPALRALIARRVATAQKVLDQSKFRTMVRLGSNLRTDSESPTLRAEFERDAVRVIDSEGPSVVWQRRFSVEQPPPAPEDDGGPSHCHLVNASEIVLAWDPPSRTMYAQVEYMSSPCHCENPRVDYAERVPPDPALR